MAKSYYKVIDGKSYDRDMLNVVSNAAPRKRGKPLIDLELAKKLLDTLVDGNEYTDIEKKTMKYIRDNYAFAKDADDYIRTEIRRFAALKSREKKEERRSNPEEDDSNMQRDEERDESSDEEDSNFDRYPSTEEEIRKNQEVQMDDSSGFRELVAYNRIDKKQSRERRKKFMIRVALVFLFLIMILGITWSVCRPKGGENSSQGLENIESMPIDSSDLESDGSSEPIVPDEEISNSKRPSYDEYARELGTAAPVYKVPVDKNDLKSSIRYINSLRVTFVKNQEQLTEETQAALDELSEVLKANPNLLIRIEGHTCWIGTKEDNQKLSESRARQVYEYLLSRGVDSKQLEYRGYGEVSSISTNRTREGRQKNRRVEFSVLNIH